MPWAVFWTGCFSKNKPLSKPKTAGNVSFPAVFRYFLVRRESTRSTAQPATNIADKEKLLEPGSPGEIGSESQTAANKSRLTAKQPPLNHFDFTAPLTRFLHKRSTVKRENTPDKYSMCKYARYVRLTYRRTFKKSGASIKIRATQKNNKPMYQKDARFCFFKFHYPFSNHQANSENFFNFFYNTIFFTKNQPFFK